MKIHSLAALTAACTFSLLLSGCALVVTKRKLPTPKAPSVVQTVSPEELIEQLNHRWSDLRSLNVTVDIQASVLKAKEGIAKDYTSFRGIILMRKPEMLRVYGRVPVIGTRMFDMVSDGKDFTLYIPSRNIAIKGSNSLRKKSANQMENLRPSFFFNAMAVQGLGKDDWYGIVSDSETVEDKARKHLYSIPEYILTISQHKPNSQQLNVRRVIVFNRENLLPIQQDLFDNDGNLETVVEYSGYADFGSIKYPSIIVIKRPLENYQLTLTVEKVTQNMTLSDDQFAVKLPEGTKIQNLE
jgi:outer membrane lipoprotein-sorting protein